MRLFDCKKATLINFIPLTSTGCQPQGFCTILASWDDQTRKKCEEQPSQPNILGIDGPQISRSSSPTLNPLETSPLASWEAIVDFPTPPFPLITINLCLTTPGVRKEKSSGRSTHSCLQHFLFFAFTSRTYAKTKLLAGTALTPGSPMSEMDRVSTSQNPTFRSVQHHQGRALAVPSARYLRQEQLTWHLGENETK